MIIILILCIVVLIWSLNIQETQEKQDISLLQVFSSSEPTTSDAPETIPILLDLSRDVITADHTKVYSEKGNLSSSICSYYPNIKLNLIYVYNDGWASIEHMGETAYVLTDTLMNVVIQETVPEEETIPKETGPVFVEEMGGYVGTYTDDGYLIVDEEVSAEGNVFARRKPSSDSEKVELISQSKHVRRIGIGKDGWSKIIYKKKTLYVASYYLSPLGTPTYEETNDIVITNRNANLRNGASINATKLCNLKKGTTLTRLAIGSNGWSKVVFEDKEVYIYSLYIDVKEPEPEAIESIPIIDAEIINKSES